MKSKKHKYKKMSEETLKSGTIKREFHYNSYNPKESGFITEIIMLFIFFFFLALSWLGLIKLIKYQKVFTIYRYINHSFSTYFPIQLSSNLLILMFLIVFLTIFISCVFFIIKIIINIIKKNSTKIFNKNPTFISIPIIFNSFLFLIGIIMPKYDETQKYYYIGLMIDIITLFILLKLNFDKKNKTNVFMINYESECMKIIFEDLLFDILLALDLYYCYYIIFQIIYLLSNSNVELLNFSGIISNFSMGLVCLYTNFNLKSIGFGIIYIIIYLGIFIFQITIRKEERDEFKIGYGEEILSFIFSICFCIQFFYLIYLKCLID